MKDEADGGISIASGSGSYQLKRIDFGNAGNTGSPTYQTSHGLFSPTAHEWIAVFKWYQDQHQNNSWSSRWRWWLW